MITLAVINTIGNEEESLGVGRLCAYLEQKTEYEVKMVYIYDYQDHKRNIEKIDPATKYLGIDIYHDTADYVFHLARDIKKRFSHIKIFVGSKFATLAFKEILEDCEAIDYVVLGDGEHACEEIIKRLESNKNVEGIPNVATRTEFENKNPIFLNIHELPRPKRTPQILNKLYKAYIYTSTTCRGNCLFCASNQAKDNQYHSAEYVFNEVKNIYFKYGINSFFIVDDSFEDPGNSIGKIKIDKFCDLILDSGLKLSFTAQIKACSFKDEDKSLLIKMRQAGFYQLYIGIESASDRELKIYRKTSNSNTNYKIMELLKSLGYDCSFFGFILYEPYSSFKDLQMNLDFMEYHKTWNILLYLSKMRIYYKTDLYFMAKSDGLLKDTYNYKSIFEYNFLDKDIDLFDIQIKSLYTFEFLDSMTSFFGYYMCYIALEDIIEIDPRIGTSIRMATNEMSKLNNEYFHGLVQGRQICNDKYMAEMHEIVREPFEHKSLFRKQVEKQRMLRIKQNNKLNPN
jgi:radical SAM superfamily enzyme YgiQ (UPF0313 family)